MNSTLELNVTPKKTKKYLFIGLAALALLLILAFGFTYFYYTERWYPNSTINGTKLSGMSFDDSVSVLQESLNTYELEINGREDGKLVITGQEIDLDSDFKDELKKLYESQHGTVFLSNLFSGLEEDMDIPITYSKEKLASVIENSDLAAGSNSYTVTSPVNAYVAEAADGSHYEIIPEEPGNEIHPEEVTSIAASAVDDLAPSIDISDAEKYPDAYIKPKYTSDSKKIVSLYNKINGYLFHWIEWDMGEGVTETLEPETIKPWLSVNEKKLSVKFDQDAFSDWLSELCLKYKTIESTRDFTTHSGKKIKVKGGDYGWRIDFDKEKEQVMEIIKGKADKKTLQSYIEEPSDELKEQLTTKREPEYSHTAYRKNHENPTDDWDHDNYSEIDLSAQMIYVYKDGEMVFSCRTISGLPTKSDRRTKTGCYFVKEKKEEKTLTGDDYSVDSKYWVRITWSGTGYHWSPRSDWNQWSPSRYKTKGSHGCLNLEMANAKQIYKLIDFDEAVFIYE